MTSRRGARRLALLLALALAGSTTWSRDARAEERPVTFSLGLGSSADGGTPLDECGGRVALERAVEERLHRTVFAPAGEADIAFDVTLERARADGSSYEAHIVERERDGAELGRRDVTIEAARCEKGIETLAVVLAIMIGPPRTKEAPVSPPAPPAPPVTPPAPAPTPPPRAEPPPPPPREEEKRRWRVAPTIEMAFGTGVLPDLAWGFQVGAVVAVPVPRLSLLARAHYWPPRSTGTIAFAEVDRLGGSIAGCYGVVRSGMAALDGCIGFDAARLHTSSTDLTRESETGALFDVFAEARFGYRFPTSRGAGGLVLEPLVSAQIAGILRRDRFTYRDRTAQERTLLQPAPAAFQAGFGVALHFL